MKLYYCDKLIYEKINLGLGIYYSYEPLSAMNENSKSNEILCIKIQDKSATLNSRYDNVHALCMYAKCYPFNTIPYFGNTGQ